MAADQAARAGDTAYEKEAWLSAALLEWGSVGRLAYVDDVPAGYLAYAPAHLVPRSVAFPTAPVSGDAVLLMTGRVVAGFTGGGLGRMLVQGVAKDLTRRGVRAIEAFGLEHGDAAGGRPVRRRAGLPAARGLPAQRRLQDRAPAPPPPAAAAGPAHHAVLARGRRAGHRAAARHGAPAGAHRVVTVARNRCSTTVFGEAGARQRLVSAGHHVGDVQRARSVLSSVSPR